MRNANFYWLCTKPLPSTAVVLFPSWFSVWVISILVALVPADICCCSLMKFLLCWQPAWCDLAPTLPKVFLSIWFTLIPYYLCLLNPRPRWPYEHFVLPASPIVCLFLNFFKGFIHFFKYLYHPNDVFTVFFLGFSCVGISELVVVDWLDSDCDIFTWLSLTVFLFWLLGVWGCKYMSRRWYLGLSLLGGYFVACFLFPLWSSGSSGLCLSK